MGRRDDNLTYSAPWSRFLLGASAVAVAILVSMAWVTWRFVPKPPWLGISLAVLMLLIVAICGLFSIRGYRIDGANLYVMRLLWETAVDLRGLESVEADPEALRGAIKLFGNGGLFSQSGIFHSKKLGRFRALATDHGNAVVLRISGKKLVVTPGEPEAFVGDILGRYPHLREHGVGTEEEN